MWPPWHLEDPAHFSLPRQSLYCDFFFFKLFLPFLHQMLISLKLVLLKCSSLSPFSSHSDKSILCSCFVRKDFPSLCPCFGSIIFCRSVGLRTLVLVTLVGHSQGPHTVLSLEGALTVFPPWLMENVWGFQGNSEFPVWGFYSDSTSREDH